jgi:glycolate oxidase
VRALDVVLPGGEVMRTGHVTDKGVTGYDLTGLVVGSEGTLGIVTRVVTRLVPAPDPALTALATFGSLDAAVRAVVALRLDRHRPSLLEILDRASIAAVQAFGEYGFPEDSEAVLLVQSDRPGHAAEDVARYGDLMTGAGATEVAVADDRQEAELLLQGRRVLSTAVEALGARIAEDVCVPVGRLGEYVRGAAEVSKRWDLRIPVSGHAGDGNLHPSIVYPYGDDDARARAWGAFDELMRLGLTLGGTVAGEHGIGSVKRRWLVEEVGAREVERQRAIKAVFDPSGIMNPEAVFGSAGRPGRRDGQGD